MREPFPGVLSGAFSSSDFSHPIENRYTTNKQRLPESVVEDMRAAYGRSEEFLQTKINEETSEEKLIRTFRKQYLLVSGFNQTEVEGMDLSALSDEELQD